MGQGLRNLLTVAWIGGMWIIGVLVAPVLFKRLPDASAATLTADLFRLIGWVGIVAAFYLMFYWLWVDGWRAIQTGRFWLLVGMLVCILINQFAVFPVLSGIKPGIAHAASGLFGGGLDGWRTISALIYLLQSLLGVAYVWREARG
ncbi:DUF4149 domain-containing protein [Chitinibacteraceae bacterium HSL-7]